MTGIKTGFIGVALVVDTLGFLLLDTTESLYL